MQLGVKTRLLAATPPLDGFEDDAVRLLAFDGEEIRLGRDEVLFRQNEAADGGYAVLSGLVALERATAIPVPVRPMPAGSLIGVNALVAAVERPATATAREPSLLLRLPRPLMLRVLDAFPEAAQAFRLYVEADLARQAGVLARIARAIDAIDYGDRSRATRTGT